MLVNELCLLNLWSLKLVIVRANVIQDTGKFLYVEPRKGVTGINISGLSLSM